MVFEKRQIGRTDVKTSSISFGCASIGNLYTPIRDEDAQELLNFAWDQGIRYFDTAPRYGSGRSEVRLGQFLKTVPRDQVVLSTKVGRVLRPGPKREHAHGFADPLPNDVHYDYSAAGFKESFEGSLERLGTDRVEILYVHDIGVVTHGAENATHMDDLLTTGLPLLEKWKREGRIGAYGLGVNECETCVEVMQHHPIDVILLAGRWTLLDRQAEVELVPLCEEKGTSLVLGGIFNSGILATGPQPGAYFDYEPASDGILAKATTLQSRCEEYGIPLPTAALHFASTRKLTSSVLIGTGKVSSLKRNLEALNIPPLPEKIFKEA